MTKRGMGSYRAVALLAAALAGACVTPPPATDAPGASGRVEDAPSRVSVRSTGGIGALDIVRIIERDGAGARFVAFTRRLCSAESPCAAFDSASGPVAAADADAVWAAARQARLDTLRADYGIGPGADRMGSEITVVAASGQRTVRGDESTLPPAVVTLMERVNAAIQAARR